jgi:Fe-S cluster biogenesis protein NfuA
MIFAVLTALSQAQGMPKAAPKNPKLVSRNSNVVVCNTIQFRRELLVSFQGRPGNITNADLQLLQHSFQQVYDSIKCGSNSKLTFRQITSVNVTRNAVISYGFSLNNTASDYVDQQFTWVVEVQGICHGCDATTFRLFATDPPAPATSPLPSGPPPPPSTPQCSCQPPRKISFLRSLNRRALLPSSIDEVLDIILLLPQRSCPAVETQFATFVAVTYTGGNITSTVNLTTQSQLLAQSVLETYNDANALNTAGVCDTQYHTLTSIQVIEALVNGSSLNGLSTTRHRHLSGTKTSNFERDFIFQIRGKCRGCPSSTLLFNDVVGRRLLAPHSAAIPDRSVLYDDMASTEAIHIMDLPNEAHEFEFDVSRHRNLPVIDGQCYCQALTSSRRIPTKGEYIQALNDRFEDIGPQGAGVVTIASTVVNIAQIVQVNCSSSVHNFTTTVLVGIHTNKTISGNELKQLGTAFQTTYNNLTQQYCDPLFRTVKSVQVTYGRRQILAHDSHEEEDGHRGLQQAVVRFVVQAQCRGCSNNTTLFAKGTSRSLRVLCSSPANRSTPVLESNPSRSLPQATTPSSCYCSANAIASTPPPVNAFESAFHQAVTSLDKTLTVVSVTDTN